VLRQVGDKAYQYPLRQNETVQLLPEKLVPNAFDDGRPEFVALVIQRLPAVLMTPTCDLDKRDVWLFSPLKEIPEGKAEEIFLGKAVSLFPLYEIQEAGLPKSVVDVGDLRPVHKNAVAQDLRLKSMSPDAYNALGEMIVRAQARTWGYAPGELAPDDGYYRCALDNKYHDLRSEPLLLELKKGDKFPDCPNCKWSHKTPQWYRLTKLQKRS
jgi:hypothetical protein